MNPLLEVIITNGLLLDAAGVLGLGLIGLAAVRLSRRNRSWGGAMMAMGAIALLVARLLILTVPHLQNGEFFRSLGGRTVSIVMIVPPILLTLGLAGIVWGLWGHERWLREGRN
jgi:hypothetical protein